MSEEDAQRALIEALKTGDREATKRAVTANESGCI